MGKAGGDETYFQRSSLFWVTVITLSFGYYTVRAAGPGQGHARGQSAALSHKIRTYDTEKSRRRNRGSRVL